jgi:MFS family permease
LCAAALFMKQTSTPLETAPSYRFVVLGLLFVVYAFNFIDRQILGILAPAIKEDLQLTDTQLGELGGLAFALLYTTLGIPIAWLADRWSRTWIMTIALSVWSAFTAACGFAANFSQLFLMRVGVGVGEAGGVAPAYSIVSDYFPPRERARALAVYSFGIPVGSAAGIAIGGVLADLIDWRMAFVIVGLAGLLIAPVFRIAVREPPRGRYDAPVAAGQQPPSPPWNAGHLAALLVGAGLFGLGAAFFIFRPAALAEAFGLPLAVRTWFYVALLVGGGFIGAWLGARAIGANKASFWLLSCGAASSSIMGYGVFFWMPSFLIRSFDFTVPQASLYYSALVLIGGVAGVWLGGALADKMGAAKRSRYALIPAAAFVLTLPCYVAGLMSNSPALAFFLFLPPTALGLVWLGPVITAVQHLAPASKRSTASALFLFINNLIGLGLGSLTIGALSDTLTARFGDEALRYSILSGTGFFLVAALLLTLAARTLHKDWVD